MSELFKMKTRNFGHKINESLEYKPRLPDVVLMLHDYYQTWKLT